MPQPTADGRCVIEIGPGDSNTRGHVATTGDLLHSIARDKLQVCTIGRNGLGGQVLLGSK